MKKFLVLVVLALLAGCATVSTQTTQIALEGGGKINLTEVDWGVQGHGGSVTKHYVSEVIAKDGSQSKVEIFDKTAQVGTAQQAVTALVAGVPGMVGQIGSAAVSGSAVKSATKATAGAMVRGAEIGLEATQYAADRHQETTMYAVDNTGPAYVDNSVSLTHFELSANAEGGAALAQTQQQQNALGGQGGAGGHAASGAYTNTEIGIGVNTPAPCTRDCGF